MEAGSQTLALLLSVLISTWMASTIAVSMRRLLPSLSFQRKANIWPGRRAEHKKHADNQPVTVAEMKKEVGHLFGVKGWLAALLPERGMASERAGFFGMNSSSVATSSMEPRYTRTFARTLLEKFGASSLR